MSGIADIFSGIGQIKQGKADYEYAKAQARVTSIVSEEQARRQEKRTKYMIGRQRLAYAAAGVEIESGSPLEMMAYTAGEGAREAAWIRWSGRTTAKYQKLAGKMKMKASQVEGWTSIGSGVGSLAGGGISGFMGTSGGGGGWGGAASGAMSGGF